MTNAWFLLRSRGPFVALLPSDEAHSTPQNHALVTSEHLLDSAGAAGFRLRLGGGRFVPAAIRYTLLRVLRSTFPRSPTTDRSSMVQRFSARRGIRSLIRLFRTDARKRPVRRATSGSDNLPSRRNCAAVHRCGVRINLTFVFSSLRLRTLDTLRFNPFARSESRIVPSKASSARVHGRACSQHCGIPSECRFN